MSAPKLAVGAPHSFHDLPALRILEVGHIQDDMTTLTCCPVLEYVATGDNNAITIPEPRLIRVIDAIIRHQDLVSIEYTPQTFPPQTACSFCRGAFGYHNNCSF